MSLAIPPQRLLIHIVATTLLAGDALLLISAQRPAPSPVYSLTALRADLARSPNIWVGRTVRVRAVAGIGCANWIGGAVPTCITGRPALLAPDAAGDDAGLPLVGAPRPALLAALHRLPLADWLLPRPQQIRRGVPSTYLVRLRAAPLGSCSSPPCYQAVLLDVMLGA